MKKFYLVKKDTLHHGQLGEVVKVIDRKKSNYPMTKVLSTKKEIVIPYDDMEDITKDYYFAQLDKWGVFGCGVLAMIVCGANALNSGHWFGTLGFAVIALTCFTVTKFRNKNE